MIVTGSSVIAASSAARWESDLSGGAATVPRSGPSGAKRIHGRATVSPRPSTSACASSARPSPATHSAIVPEDMSGAG